MSYAQGARCFHCLKQWPLSQIQYVCPECQGNVEIIYDYAQIAKVATREYFQKNTDFSIWRYEPLLPVQNQGTIPLQIGWTPLYPMRYYGAARLYIKDDGRNPSASFKDRASAIALLHAKAIGAQQMTGASTGNAGSSMACLAASVGMPLVIFVPEKAPQAKIAQLLIFGAEVILVKGTYDDAFNLCLEVSKKFGWYSRNTGYNPYTREGKKTCAYEISEQLHWQAPDWVLVSVGDGNIISGLWKGFKDLYQIGLISKLPKLGAIQSRQSNSIAKTIEHYHKTQKLEIQPVAATTIADSISVDIPRDGLAAAQAILESKGMPIEVDDTEILAAIAQTGKQWGIFGEPAGVTSIAGFNKMEEMHVFPKNATVVCVLTGNGLKDVASAIKTVGKPVCIEPSISAVEKVVVKIK